MSKLESVTLTAAVLKKYPNRYFIETGTYHGGAVVLARECGFDWIKTIELSPLHFWAAFKAIGAMPGVACYLGDSTKELPMILDAIEDPATFWLDGHTIPGDATTASGEEDSGWKHCPILLELAEIEKHHIKTHTILIDDIDECGTATFDGITIDDVKMALLAINNDYRFTYEDGGRPGSILVATPLKTNP